MTFVVAALVTATSACGGETPRGDADITSDADVETDAVATDADIDDGPDADTADADSDDSDLDADSDDIDRHDADSDADRHDAEIDGDEDALDLIDLDEDGLDDELEDRIVEEYLPFLSVDPEDGCPLSAIVYRVRPHPEDPSLVHALIDNLFERDCGAAGHVGDNEVFGMTIDPFLPPPEGILALRAIAHQSTLCEHVSECGLCSDGDSCAMALRGDVSYPVVFYSRGKHGAYLSESACDFSCFLTNWCVQATTSTDPPRINVGEPDAPLVRDLTAAGIIVEEAGWTEDELFGYDPWGSEDFGGAGRVAEDLVDDAFLTPTCGL